jgi:hypothetical protein
MSYNVGSCAAMTEIPLVRAFDVGKRREASPALTGTIRSVRRGNHSESA